jgi:hypothetical protein
MFVPTAEHAPHMFESKRERRMRMQNPGPRLLPIVLRAAMNDHSTGLLATLL